MALISEREAEQLHHHELNSVLSSSLFKVVYTWKIENYSFVGRVKPGQWLTSVPFLLGGLKWSLELFPFGQKGNSSRHPNCAVVFITCYNLASKEELAILAEFTLKNKVPANSWHSRDLRPSSITSADRSVGRNTAIFGDALLSRSNGYLFDDDSLTLKLTLSFVRDCVMGPAIPEHRSSLTSDLGEVLASQELSDVQLLVSSPDGVILATRPVHKLILSARSPVFRAMFTGERFRESKESTIEINDCSVATIDALLEYMYADTLPSPEQAYDLFICADKYQVMNLAAGCQSVLAQHFTIESACQCASLVDRLGGERYPDFRQLCIDFLSSHVDLCSNPHFKRFMVTDTEMACEVFSSTLCMHEKKPSECSEGSRKRRFRMAHMATSAAPGGAFMSGGSYGGASSPASISRASARSSSSMNAAGALDELSRSENQAGSYVAAGLAGAGGIVV